MQGSVAQRTADLGNDAAAFGFGLSPVLVGTSLTWAAGKPHLLNSRGLRIAIGAGIGCMVLALLLAKPS